jgi:hypothetical protein
MSDELAYNIWRFLVEYPKRKRNGEAFQIDFASLLDKVKDYSIVARFTDGVETASGILSPPDLLVNVKSCSDIFIIFECKSGRRIDIDVAAAFFAKVHDIAHKNEMVIFRIGNPNPLRYGCEKLYRVLISLHEPSQDALGFCWGNGIPVFYPAKLPEGVVPVKVIRHKLSLFSPSNSDQEKTKNYYLERIDDLDDKMFSEAREDPKDYRELTREVKEVTYGVNTLINRRWT